MAARMTGVASTIRQYAKDHSFELPVSAAMIMDTRDFGSKEMFEDEFSRIGKISSDGKSLNFLLLPPAVPLSIIDLYSNVCEAIKSAGYTPVIKQSTDVLSTYAYLNVVIENGGKKVGIAHVMSANQPALGVPTGTYDANARPNLSFNERRGVFFDFDEDHQLEAEKVTEAYFGRIKQHIPKSKL
jgi:hypothetical protein